jgi:hypothetical protein
MVFKLLRYVEPDGVNLNFRQLHTGALFPQVAVNVGVAFLADLFLVISLNRICFANCIDSDTANTLMQIV